MGRRRDGEKYQQQTELFSFLFFFFLIIFECSEKERNLMYVTKISSDFHSWQVSVSMVLIFHLLLHPLDFSSH